MLYLFRHMAWIKKYQSAAIIILSILLIYVFTNNPLTSFLKLQLVIALLFVFILYSRTVKAKNSIYYYLIIALILSLVGATGWYFSPFFFLLYFSALLLAFIFDTYVSIAFLLTLAVIFSLNIGQVDLTYDFLTVLSLLAVIPLSLYLRHEYLKLKESEKDILILRQETNQANPNVIEDALANKISHFAASLKQPLNDVKQLVYFLQHSDNPKKNAKYLEEAAVSAQTALNQLQKFEETVAGKKFTPSKSS